MVSVELYLCLIVILLRHSFCVYFVLILDRGCPEVTLCRVIKIILITN